jgi:hypothetical protein
MLLLEVSSCPHTSDAPPRRPRLVLLSRPRPCTGTHRASLSYDLIVKSPSPQHLYKYLPDTLQGALPLPRFGEELIKSKWICRLDVLLKLHGTRPLNRGISIGPLELLVGSELGGTPLDVIKHRISVCEIRRIHRGSIERTLRLLDEGLGIDIVLYSTTSKHLPTHHSTHHPHGQSQHQCPDSD